MYKGKYFSVPELCMSTTARKKGINNDPNPEQERNLIALIEKLLDPLREMYGRPIYINSGFRCYKLNKIVGGSKNSEHMYGFAADATTGTRDGNLKLFELIKRSGLKWHQLINEKPDAQGRPCWIHISYNPNKLTNQVITIK